MNTKTLILFGDSLFGRFGKALIQELEDAANNKITVINCSAGGYTSQDGVKLAPLLKPLNPDYLVLSFGSNDCPPWKKQVPTDEFATNINTIIDNFLNSKIIFFLCPPGNDTEDPEGTKQFNELLSNYNSIIKKICQEKGAAVIDSESIYGKILKQGNDYHMGDGMHLNKSGYEVFIKELSQLLQ